MSRFATIPGFGVLKLEAITQPKYRRIMWHELRYVLTPCGAIVDWHVTYTSLN